MLTRKDILEYKQIFKKVYNEDISYREAEEQANRLLNLFKIICSPPLEKRKRT